MAWKSALPHGPSYPRSGKFGANHPLEAEAQPPSLRGGCCCSGVCGKMAPHPRPVQPSQRLNCFGPSLPWGPGTLASTGENSCPGSHLLPQKLVQMELVMGGGT